ncbi:sulfite exporter TauE/SafE family protein [Oceanobacillus manasiensis]|uniref:sulfite exporter TauE/SafE family protein n=1 Tax=Oceanobacillus manasiensis TaxID=586413 RepID=UPI0005A81E55|nr:sulfite exporter TauE/SafE family protein [Oceanobacillus manasiensis]
MVFLICIFIGLLSAFIGALMGLGGGVVLIPSLLFAAQVSSSFAWVTPQSVVGISLIVMVFTALSSTIAYLKNGRVDYRTGLLFLLGSVPGGMIGSWLNQYINTESFQLYFGFIIIVVSMLFFLNKNSKQKKPLQGKPARHFESQGEIFIYHVPFWTAFFVSLTVGILSGLFGIGGGAIMVPVMILLFGMPAHIAIATSMFMIFFVSVIGTSSHITLGHMVWEYAFYFIPGAWIGGKLGAKVNQLLTGKMLEGILRIVLIMIGIRMIYQGLM